MSPKYLQVFVALSLYLTGICTAFSQSGPEFITCTDSIIRLCVKDEGVKLPDNNQVYLGERHPDANSCSVHVTQKKRVSSTCGNTLQYEVLLFLNDTSSGYILKTLTSITTDSLGEAELSFDTQESIEGIIRTSGIPFTSDCGGYHLVKWVVMDSCESLSICEQYISLYDCMKPQVQDNPAELFIIKTNLGGLAHVSASDFIHTVLDDCTSKENLLFSLKSNEYRPDSLMPCDHVPAYGVEILEYIWVADQGNDVNCNDTIEWHERTIYQHPFHVVYLDGFGGCDPVDETFTLAGNIHTEDFLNIKGAEVSLHSTGHVFPTNITGSNGNYSFNNIIIPGEVEITISKNDFHKNGVSTLDLVKIQKHLLGIEELVSPYDLIAADANDSWVVSAIDLVEIRRLILGIYKEFPRNKSWRFVRENFEFQPDDPWSDWQAWANGDIETITINGNSSQGDLDFIGIKIGDLNNTVQPDATHVLPRNSLPKFELFVDQQSFKPGDIIHIPVRLTNSQAISGFQFTINASSLEVIDIISGIISVGKDDFALFGDKATISWFDENNVDVSAGDVLFIVQARAMKEGSLSQSFSINSDITEAELYLENEETFLPVLNIPGGEADHILKINSITPNPWKEEATVDFFLPKEDQVTFTLFDVSGREVYTHSAYFNGGSHQHQLKAADFSARGMMFFEINSSKQRVIQKMIVLD